MDSTTTWITYRQAAERYQVSVRTLQRMVKAGEVEARRLPRRMPKIVLNTTDIESALGEVAPWP